jgi:hypothetical protein
LIFRQSRIARVKKIICLSLFSFVCAAQNPMITLNAYYEFTMCFVNYGGGPYLGPVRFESTAQSFSGNHNHTDGLRPAGSLEYTQLNTQTNGCVTNRFYPTDSAGHAKMVSGTYDVVGYAIPHGYPEGSPAHIFVTAGVSWLQSATSSPDYVFDPPTTAHPTLPRATANVILAMPLIARDFHIQYGLIMRFNDASLPWGGRFDLGPTYPNSAWWGPDHQEHMYGLNVDCPYAIKDLHGIHPYEAQFRVIAEHYGGGDGSGGVLPHSDHFHLRFAN